MQAIDQVLGSNGMDISSLAARFGVSPDQAQSALGSLMPAVLGGFQKKAEADDLAPATAAASNADQPDSGVGNDILDHIFGGKAVSRQVADHAAGQTGVSPTVLKAMLPVIAAMVAKHLAGQGGGAASAGGGGLGGMLGSVLGGGSAGGGLGGLGGLLGGGGNGGNPLDQILARMR